MLWDKESQEACKVREIGKQYRPNLLDIADLSCDFLPYAPWLESESPGVVANTVICLIHQANYLLDKQIAGLERQFVNEGGYTERLAAARYAAKGKQSDQPDAVSPNCPNCGKTMVIRTAHKGPKAGGKFWGCTANPDCKGTREY